MKYDIKESGLNSELLKEFNKDEIDNNSKMSSIDLMTRLNEVEIANLLAIDSLVSMRFLPEDMLRFSRQKKRLNISLEGKGRSEVIEIFKTPQQENEELKKKSFLSRLMGK